MAAGVATMSQNIAAYEKVRGALETDHWGEFAVFYDGEMKGAFQEFPEAMAFAAEQWGRGPYLIRQVGRPPLVMPASVQFRRIYADG